MVVARTYFKRYLGNKHLTGAMIVMSSTVAAGTVAVIWLFMCDKLTVKDGLKMSAESGSAEYGKF